LMTASIASPPMLRDVTGPAARKAFNLSQEDPRLRRSVWAAASSARVLLARRLVGRCDLRHALRVQLGITTGQPSQWPEAAPALDSGDRHPGADLYDRRPRRRVLLRSSGASSGRSPRSTARRPRAWPNAISALDCRGGSRMGQVIGAHQPKGEQPVERGPSVSPRSSPDRLPRLGIDTATISSRCGPPQGRPSTRAPISDWPEGRLAT